MKPTLLKDDLQYYLDGYDTNPCKTAAQRARWCKSSGRRKAIVHTMLGNQVDGNGREPLCLLEADGWDGNPVFEHHGSRAAESLWDYNDNHIFPDVRGLVRFATFFHLEFHQAVALVTKGLWEEWFAKEQGYAAGNGVQLIDVLLDEGRIEAARNRFNPDTQSTFNLFEEHRNQATQAGYDAKDFDALVQELVQGDYHLRATDSAELANFSQRKIKEREQLREAHAEDKEQHLIAKLAWLQKIRELGEILLTLETRRLKNANIRNDYLHIFGQREAELMEQKIGLRDVELRLQLMEPGMTEAEIEQQVEKLLSQLEQEFDQLRFDVAQACETMSVVPGTGTAIGDEELSAYKRECQEVLKEIRLLLHEDRLRNHPAFHKLSKVQREKLNDILVEVLKIKKDEVGIPAPLIGRDLRSLGTLQDILAEAKAILAHAGMETEVRYVIQGETLAEQLQWLENQIRFLESEIEGVRAEILALSEDKDIKEKQAVLANPNKHEEILADMQKRAEEYRQQAEALKAELASLFERKAA